MVHARGDGLAGPGSRRGIISGSDSLGGRAFMGSPGEADRSGIRDHEVEGYGGFKRASTRTYK